MNRRFCSFRKFAAAIPLVALAVALTGCGSISNSVESISTSVTDALESMSNSFNNSSESSSPGDSPEASLNYQRDVHGFTVAWFDRREPDGDLVRGVGRIAELHGITNWEAAPATVRAMREALEDPRLSEEDRARLRLELASMWPVLEADAEPQE